MAHTLGSAIGWIQIDLVAPDGTDSVFSIEGTEHAILARPCAQPRWSVRVREPGLTGTQAEFAVVKAHLDAHVQACTSLPNHSDPGAGSSRGATAEPTPWACSPPGLLPTGAERAEEEGPLEGAVVVERTERFRQA